MKRNILIGLSALLCAISMWAAPASGNSATGRWKLEVSKSSYGSMPSPKMEVMAVTRDEATSLAWKLTGASTDGKSYVMSYNGPIDGKYHAMDSTEMGGSTVAYRRMGSNVSWTMKNKEGQVVETGRSEISPDGNTLTLKGMVEGPKGKENFVSVFQRVQ